MASISITNNIVNKIITNAVQQLYQNNLVRQQLPNYTTDAFFDKTTDLIYNAVNVQNFPSTIQLEKQPKNISRDIMNFQSIRKIKSLANKKIIKPNLSLNQTKSPRIRQINNIPISISPKKESQKKENNLKQQVVKIKIQSNSKKIIPQKIAKAEKESEQIMRNALIHRQQFKKNTQIASKLQIQAKANDSHNIKNKFDNETTNNAFSFDHEGNLTYYDKKRNYRALKKQYPPLVNYSFDNLITPEQIQNKLEEKTNHASYHKIKSARGHAFASSVLKTVNLSKISISNSINPHNQDPIQFMLRNDLFNNNHSRQTSSIPYLQMKEGTVYTQKQTKQSATNKSQPQSTTNRTNSHYISMQRAQFKKYTQSNKLQLNHNNSLTEQNMDIDNPKIHRRETMSGNVNKRRQMEIVRPRTTQIEIVRPRTTQNLGRITTNNHTLALSLIES